MSELSKMVEPEFINEFSCLWQLINIFPAVLIFHISKQVKQKEIKLYFCESLSPNYTKLCLIC